MKTCNENHALMLIESLKKNGRQNIILTDCLSNLQPANVFYDFFVRNGMLWIENNYGEMASKREVERIIEFLAYSVENWDEDESIKDEIDDLFEEIRIHRMPRDEEQKIKPKKEGYVYLVIGETGRHKIGYSKNPKNRIQQLKLASSEKLELVYCCKVDNPDKVEEDLHKKYEKKRSHSEWFDLSENDIEEIKEMLGGAK